MSTTLVVTSGQSSVDLYSQRLASFLPVPQLWTRIYQESAHLFGISFLSPFAFRSVYCDLRFIARLRRLRGIIHLPNQHLGRYTPFTRVSRVVITVHDLSRYFDLTDGDTLIHSPNLRDRLYLGCDFRGIRNAAHIITASMTAKTEVMRHLGVSPEHVTVVHHGVDTNVFHPAMGPRPLPFPYILYVGSEHPRKNLSTLLGAFAVLKAQGGFQDLKLVKVGRTGGKEADFRRATLKAIERHGLERQVVIKGFVPDQELAVLYQHAECFLFPTVYEGFGWPPLEAMACGTPVIASTAAAVKEILGDAAVLVEPTDVDGWAMALLALLNDDAMRGDLRRRGLKRAAQFTWEQAASKTMQVYEMVEENWRGRIGHTSGRLRAEKDSRFSGP